MAGILSAVEATWNESGAGTAGGQSGGVARVNEIGKTWTEGTGVYQVDRVETNDIQKRRVQLSEGEIEGGWSLKDWRRAAVSKDKAIIRHLQSRGGNRVEVSVIDLAENLTVLLYGVGGEVGSLDERAPSDRATRCLVGLVRGGQFENLVGPEDNADGP